MVCYNQKKSYIICEYFMHVIILIMFCTHVIHFLFKKLKPFIEVKLGFRFIPKLDHICMIYKFAHIYYTCNVDGNISSKCKLSKWMLFKMQI